MRFHVVSLPHTQTTKAFSSCAYTEKVRKFCSMMMDRGHEVFLYAAKPNEARCTERIVCITDREREAAVGQQHYTSHSFDSKEPDWNTFNSAAIGSIRERAKPHDFLCLIGGHAQKPIADAFPKLMTVEFGIGYSGVFASFRVWESYAWMHTCYGAMAGRAENANGQFYDVVIPNYFEIEDFPFSPVRDDYFLYMGRLIDRKGFNIAIEVCKRMDKRLILAGPGGPADPKEYRGYGEYVGVVGPKERGLLMSRAQAIFVPTQYVEPFGGVAVEAMLCGTPAITTDWGAFTETVQQGRTGFRCSTLAEFIQAAKCAPKLDRSKIRRYAIKNYSTRSIAPRYEDYFKRLETLWGNGWYQT